MNSFSHTLLCWYEENRRDLPWRGENDPYKIWISEVILQQTRVAQGWDYYHRFIVAFPTISHLAAAAEEQVLKIWQGLGYYSRARHLHAAAQTIMQQHAGIFPKNYHDIRALKGIGAYTAAAIASLAFQLPYPAVDGNVMRLVARVVGIVDDIGQPATVKQITTICEKWIDRSRPADFNQALMDFGSLVCTPAHSRCETCPFQPICYAFQHQQVTQIPIKNNQIIIKERYFNYILFAKNGQIIIQKRQQKDIWKNLFELPLIESQTEIAAPKIQEILLSQHHIQTSCCQKVWHTKAKLTHRIIHASFYLATVDKLTKMTDNQKIISLEEFSSLPVHRIMQLFFAQIEIP